MSLVRELVTGIADMAGIPPGLVFTKDRRQGVAWVKAMVCRWLRAHENGYSTTGIGEKLGIDHSSVLHLVNREWPTTPPKLNKRYEPGAKPARPTVTLKSIAMPPRAKKTGERIMDFMSAYESTGEKIYNDDIAARFSISPGAASSILANLHNAGKIRRIEHGAYLPIPKPLPVAVVAVMPSTAFIRPISKERMMAGR